jgi:hypothetical protein
VSVTIEPKRKYRKLILRVRTKWINQSKKKTIRAGRIFMAVRKDNVRITPERKNNDFEFLDIPRKKRVRLPT